MFNDDLIPDPINITMGDPNFYFFIPLLFISQSIHKQNFCKSKILY